MKKADVEDKLRQVKLLALDFDGVLTPANVIVSSSGEEAVICSHRDGQGIESLIAMGLPVVVVSGQRSEYVARRCDKMKIDFVRAVMDKPAALRQYLAEKHPELTLNDVCFVGDDTGDLALMREVLLPVCVADGMAEAKAAASWVTKNLGGLGAVREVCEALMPGKPKTEVSQEIPKTGIGLPGLFSLKGTTAVITGATGFFGTYFVRTLAEAGAHLVLVSNDDVRVRQLGDQLHGQYAHQRFHPVIVDSYQIAETQQILSAVTQEHDVRVLVNNAFDFSERTGFNHPSGRLEVAPYDHLKASFDSGVYWAIQATQVFGQQMLKQRKGSIINICSMYAVVVPHPSLYEDTEKFNPPGYSMAKAGLLQFTKYAASFFAPVRVNALSPGAIPNLESETYNTVSSDEQEFLQRLVGRTLIGRVGHPRDLVGGLLYLASNASSYVTGHNLVIDGGWTVT